ncbi:WD40 repeat-like protein [Phlegmacium glaucopus]|nr:WD40 repeat-like protein [Phlegmacium glaucopus]
MPEIPVGAQIFDVVFHPMSSTVYTGLLTGYVKAFSYDDQGNHAPAFSVRPSKSSCRGLSLDQDGSHLYAVGKGKSLSTIDTLTESIDTRRRAHECTINRVKHLMPWLLSTGDDDGVVKLWDPRQRDCIRVYTQHSDYITDFLWLDDKKQLVATSGDGTLSVMDIRSKKTDPIAHSEDQEDELLSIVAIKGASKFVVGTQLGILSIFNRSSGWGDCVDRVPGHPLSVDALCTLPADLPNVDTTSTVLTGSSDGYVRAVQILPTKLLGVVVDHAIGGGMSQLSIEEDGSTKPSRIPNKSKASQGETSGAEQSQRRWWVGSVGHDDTLRMTDLEGFFRDTESTEIGKGAFAADVRDDDSDTEADGGNLEEGSEEKPEIMEADNLEPDDEGESGEESDIPQPKKRKRKAEKNILITKKKKSKGKNSIAVDHSFFDEL